MRLITSMRYRFWVSAICFEAAKAASGAPPRGARRIVNGIVLFVRRVPGRILEKRRH
jgi:hypothetical protein